MSDITLRDIAVFLNAFKVKAKVFGIKFRNDRTKNIESLFRLSITPIIRERIVLSLEEDDYSAGPLLDTLNKGAEMWVFGKDYDGHELYIKITLGEENEKAVCVSFHEAERPMSHPYRQEEP